MTEGVNGSEFAKGYNILQRPQQQPQSRHSHPQVPTTAESTQKCDILLNNFQIKKKRYRVLLNYDHIVWERLDAKQRSGVDGADDVNKSKKETEIEREQRSQPRRVYSNSSNVVHIDEIVRVAKGNTKAATFRNTPPQYVDYLTDFSTLPAGEQQRNPSSLVSPTQQPSSPTAPQAEQFLTIHYAERIVKSETDCNRWRVTSLTLYNSDAYIIRQWYNSLSNKLNSSSKRLRIQRLLVFINPYGGRKEGLRVYERYCKPLFQLAGIDASCLISQRANQIRDILMGHDLASYDAVCCVGGDGTVAEVINGLIFRRMRDLGMDPSQPPPYIPKPALAIGIIPAGSTDTIAYTLHGTSDVRTAAIHLILGQRRGLDISSVQNCHGIIRFCASVLSYGYLGDVAAKSENYRWMGTKRYEFTGVKAFLSNRGYEAEVQVLMPDEADAQSVPVEQQSSYTIASNAGDSGFGGGGSIADSKCYAGCQRCSTGLSLHEDALANLDSATDDDIDDEMPTSSNASIEVRNASDGTRDINTIRNSRSAMELESVTVGNIKIVENYDTSLNTVDVENDPQMDKQYITLSEEPSTITGARTAVNEVEVDAPTNTMKNNSVSIGSISSINNINQNNNIQNPIATKNKNTTRNNNWKLIRGKFFMISGANIACACTRSPNGISRYSHLGDGYLDLVLVRKTSRFNNIRFVINTMGRNGDISNLPFVEVYRTRKFRFRASTSCSEEYLNVSGSCQPIAVVEDTKISSWNCDGEIVTDLDITMSSHCQLVDVFMRGPYSYVKPIKDEGESAFCCCTSSSS